MKFKHEAGWRTRLVLAKVASFPEIDRNLHLFEEDKKELEKLGFKEVELSFVRDPGSTDRGVVYISIENIDGRFPSLLFENNFQLDYSKYSITFSSRFYPEDEVEEE